MKWLLSFLLFNVIKKNNVKKTITSHLNKESFVGSWVINENKKNQIIHFKPQGAIYKSGKKKSNYIGYWHTNENIFNFNLRDNNIEKKYYGKIYNNTLYLLIFFNFILFFLSNSFNTINSSFYGGKKPFFIFQLNRIKISK